MAIFLCPNLLFAVDQSSQFRGRIYLAPSDLDSENTSLFINFGTNVFPKYRSDLLGDAITEQNYSNLCNELKQFNTLFPSTAALYGASVCLGCCFPCCCCGFCPFFYYERVATNVVEDMKKCVEAAAWKMPAKLEVLLGNSVNGNHPGSVGWDENGVMCSAVHHAKHSPEHTDVVWPPPGFNIIVTINGDSVRKRWPRRSVTHCAPAVEMVRPEVTDISSELRKLAALKTEGLLSEDEYVAAKSKLLSS